MSFSLILVRVVGTKQFRPVHITNISQKPSAAPVCFPLKWSRPTALKNQLQRKRICGVAGLSIRELPLKEIQPDFMEPERFT